MLNCSILKCGAKVASDFGYTDGYAALECAKVHALVVLAVEGNNFHFGGSPFSALVAGGIV